MQVWRAFAKINLELSVLGRRPDGYHAVHTLLQATDLHDEIWVSPSEQFRFTSSREPADESNLVVRAVRAFEQQTSVSVGLHLDLRKRIPERAGLGGGSSDAAVTLMGLDRYFRTRIPGEEMMRMLSRLGSDVPFFWVGGLAVAVGRGDVIFPMPDPAPVWHLLACPRIGIDTAEAYSWLTQTPESNNILSFCARFVPELGTVRPGYGARLNDFEGPLFRRFPELAELKRKLLAAGARFAALTGSGSALFGEFESEAAARQAAEALGGGDGPEAETIVVRPLGRQEYFGRMFDASWTRSV